MPAQLKDATTFEDLQRLVDDQLWEVSSGRLTPTLQIAGDPSADENGTEAADVITALLESHLQALGFESMFSQPEHEFETGRRATGKRSSLKRTLAPPGIEAEKPSSSVVARMRPGTTHAYCTTPIDRLSISPRRSP